MDSRTVWVLQTEACNIVVHCSSHVPVNCMCKQFVPHKKSWFSTISSSICPSSRKFCWLQGGWAWVGVKGSVLPQLYFSGWCVSWEVHPCAQSWAFTNTGAVQPWIWRQLPTKGVQLLPWVVNCNPPADFFINVQSEPWSSIFWPLPFVTLFGITEKV